MEVVDCDETPQWSEEILFKLSCKELKKLARQSNVNPNFKKAELVKALLSTSGQTFSDITEKIQSKTRARVTRSRASVFQLLNKSDNITGQESIPETYVQGSDVTDTISVNEKKVKSKRRGKSLTQTNKQDPVNNKTFEIFKIVSSIQKNVHPLTEITNSDYLPSDKVELSVSTGSSNQKLKGNVKNNVKLSFSHENPNTKDDCVPDNTFKSEFNDSEKEKINLTVNMLSSAEEKTENKTRRRGRKRKNMEENDDTVKTHKRAAAVDVNNFSDCGLTEHTKSQSPIRNRRQISVAKGFHDSCEKSIEDDSRGNIIATCTVKEDINKTLELKAPSLKRISSTMIGHECDKTPPDSSSTKRKTKCESLKKKPITPDLFCEENEVFNFGNEEIGYKNVDKDQDNTVPEPEVMPVPVRSSTFVFANDNNQSRRKSSLKANCSGLPSRRNTFTIDEIDNRETTLKHFSKGHRFDSPKRSNTFTIEEDAVNKKDTPAELPRKIEKSIGKRILSASIKKGTVKPPVKQNSSSSVKKTITKTAITPGSAYRNKFGVTRKLPNFKSIHQKLFNKMESLNDNEKRKQERAQLLIQSPIVPRCAVAFSSIKKEQQKDEIDSSTKKVLPSSQIQSPGLSSPSFTKASKVLPSSRIHSAGLSSPTFTKATTPAINKKPLAKTPSVNPQPLMGTKSVNRFGFRNHPKKLEAMNIVGKKLPPTSMEKSKDKERTLLQGVRMNKRFMLQMQMRQKLDC